MALYIDFSPSYTAVIPYLSGKHVNLVMDVGPRVGLKPDTLAFSHDLARPLKLLSA